MMSVYPFNPLISAILEFIYIPYPREIFSSHYRESSGMVPYPPLLKGMSKYLRIGKTKILKNPVPESEPTPLGFWSEALTNKKHSRTRSVPLMFPIKSSTRGLGDRLELWTLLLSRIRFPFFPQAAFRFLGVLRKNDAEGVIAIIVGRGLAQGAHGLFRFRVFVEMINESKLIARGDFVDEVHGRFPIVSFLIGIRAEIGSRELEGT